MENCIYEDIDKLDSLSLSSSEQNSNQSYDISQVNYFEQNHKLLYKVQTYFHIFCSFFQRKLQQRQDIHRQ